MRVSVGLLAILILMPSAAGAQSTSRCGWEFGKWVCRTEATQQRDIVGAASDARRDGYNQMDAFRESAARRQADADQRAQADADRSRSLDRERLETYEMIERYIAIGRCSDAVDLAYRELGSTEGDKVAARC